MKHYHRQTHGAKEWNGMEWFIYNMSIPFGPGSQPANQPNKQKKSKPQEFFSSIQPNRNQAKIIAIKWNPNNKNNEYKYPAK